MTTGLQQINGKNRDSGGRTMEESIYIFVIDTNRYAGNFERQMCAYMTGIIGECEVGKREAELYKKAYPDDDRFDDLIISEPDDNNCYRPVAIIETPGTNQPGQYGLESNSVGIFMEREPTPDEADFLLSRAKEYCKNLPEIMQAVHSGGVSNLMYGNCSEVFLRSTGHPIEVLGSRLLVRKTTVSEITIGAKDGTP